MKRFACLTLIAAMFVLTGRAATLVTFKTSVGTMELEFFDDHKPVTVSNFIKYAQSGRFDDMFIQRWETNFVIQGGGFTLERRPDAIEFRQVPTFGTITNEYRTGGVIYSNVFGTIAMARQGGKTNSATSQWFINVKDNLFLDGVDGGFTVFGRVTSGTNVLNLFRFADSGIHQASVPNHLNSYNEIISGLNTVPVSATNATFNDLILVDVFLRREMGIKIALGRNGKTLSWNSVAAVTNAVEYSTNFTTWSTLSSIVGSGNVATIQDPSNDPKRYYRVRLQY